MKHAGFLVEYRTRRGYKINWRRFRAAFELGRRSFGDFCDTKSSRMRGAETDGLPDLP